MENVNEREEELLVRGDDGAAIVNDEEIADGEAEEKKDSAPEESDGNTDNVNSEDGESRINESAGENEVFEDIKDADEEAVADTEEKSSFARKLFDFAELFVFTLAAVILLLSFVFRHAEVLGHSMDNTLADGEHLIISDLFYTPRRGDIVVFEDYSTIHRTPLIKRIIAVGGDRLRISDGSVYVNGELLDESGYIRTSYTTGTIDKIIPEGEVFVMGDNRGESDDSRNPLIGTIDEDAILGKVILRFYPFKSFGSVN